MPLGAILGGIGSGLVGALFGGGDSGGGGGIGGVAGSVLQAQAMEDAIGFQRDVFNTEQKNLAPLIGALPGATSQWQTLLGLGPGGMGGALDALRATPGYQFAKDQGLDAILSRSTATGGVGGGNTLKELMKFGTGLADNTYQSALGNIQALAGLGENAAVNVGNTGVGAASNLGNAYAGLGNAQAAGAAYGSNTIGNILGSIFGGGGGMGGGFNFGTGGIDLSNPFLNTDIGSAPSFVFGG